ncbi:MAG: EAL domain-containing protein [Egibacteraceae bacterium]
MTAPDAERARERIARIVSGTDLPGSMRLVVVGAVTLMIVLAAGLVHATGGTQHAWPHLLYLPVLVAAWAFGPAGGVAAGVVAGLAVGPAMAIDVASGTMQSTVNWLYRLGFFSLIGATSGGMHQLVRDQLVQTRRERRRFASLVDNAPDVVLACDSQGVIRYASPSGTAVLGHPVDHLVGQTLVDLIHADDASALMGMTQGPPGQAWAPVELRARHADGSWRHLEMVANNLLDDPDVAAVVCNARDVTERRAIESELHHQLAHDPATGLPNLLRFTEELEQSLAGRTPGGAPTLAVLLIHLDRYQNVRETLGSDTSEQVVTAMAHRLSSLLRANHSFARLAITEFAVLCTHMPDATTAHETATRLLEAVDEPFLLVVGEVHLSACIGVALAGDGANNADELLRDAHTAAYRAAREGEKIATFEVPWRHQAATALDTETALHSALRRDEFTLCYQPVIDLVTRETVGLEALIRWRHPTLGTVPPHDFIPLAEQTGMIVPIGRWVLQTACAQLASWRRELALDDLTIAVNISARQLNGTELVDDLQQALAASGLPPGALILELTETAILGNTSRAVEVFSNIKDVGVRLAIDDFGIGYSSLSYLKRLPVDILKIDRLFVSQLGQASEDDAIVSAIIGLSRSLGLDIIAEGVEEHEQADRLVELGCTKAQGFLYCRPQPALAIPDYLTGKPAHLAAGSVGPPSA